MSKYLNKKTFRDGYSFQSKFEAEVYDLLKQENVKNLKCQIQVYLTDARIIYKPDFSYESEDEIIYVEAKGFETASWRIKRKLWMYYGPGKLLIYKKKYRAYLHETIIPRAAK